MYNKNSFYKDSLYHCLCQNTLGKNLRKVFFCLLCNAIANKYHKYIEIYQVSDANCVHTSIKKNCHAKHICQK